MQGPAIYSASHQCRVWNVKYISTSRLLSLFFFPLTTSLPDSTTTVAATISPAKMATPLRNTRSRSRQTTPSALPAVDRKTSHGYGARGKANLSSQLAAAGTTLAEGFTTARGMAPLLEESLDEEERASQLSRRQGTVVESFALYEGSQRSQRRDDMPPPPPPSAPPPPAARRASSSPPPTEPWSLSVLLFAVPRYLWRNFWSLLVGALILGLAANISLPKHAGLRRDTFFRGLKVALGLPAYDRPPEHAEALWMWVRYNSSLIDEFEGVPEIKDPQVQGWVNIRLRQLIQDLETNQTVLFDRVGALEEFLPRRMVVDVVDDQLIIKDEFWQVLTSKLKGDNEVFDAFVAANEKAATDIAFAASEGHLSAALESKRVLRPEDMMRLLNEYAEDLDKKLEVWSGEQMAVTRKHATQIAKEISQDAASDPKTQISVLIKSRIIANIYESLSDVNYFSPNTGAIVDPHHTSTTALRIWKDPKVGWFGRSLKRPSPPPVAALMKWEETGDCWCASKTIGIEGRAQLAVITENIIAPRRLIIEHIPSAGTRSISSAPQRFELWAESFSVETAQEWRQQLRRGYPRYDAECTEASAPTDTAVCITSGTYDIHAENWVQSFPMFMEMDSVFPMISAGKFYYRVMSNWHAAQTCTYRVRLTGTDTEESEFPHAF